MTLAGQLKGVAIALAILIACFPPAVIMTLSAASFWRWLERTFGLEAFGHSGPAEWCYLATYFVLVAAATFVWSRARRGRARGR